MLNNYRLSKSIIKNNESKECSMIMSDNGGPSYESRIVNSGPIPKSISMQVVNNETMNWNIASLDNSKFLKSKSRDVAGGTGIIRIKDFASGIGAGSTIWQQNDPLHLLQLKMEISGRNGHSIDFRSMNETQAYYGGGSLSAGEYLLRKDIYNNMNGMVEGKIQQSAYTDKSNWKPFSDLTSLNMIVINPTTDGSYNRGEGDLQQQMTSVKMTIDFSKKLDKKESIVVFKENTEQIIINNNNDISKVSWPAIVTSSNGDPKIQIPNLLASL
jgi:hypothetical protein